MEYGKSPDLFLRLGDQIINISELGHLHFHESTTYQNTDEGPKPIETSYQVDFYFKSGFNTVFRTSKADEFNRVKAYFCTTCPDLLDPEVYDMMMANARNMRRQNVSQVVDKKSDFPIR